MYDIVEADTLMGILLKQRERVPFKDLFKLKDKIERKYRFIIIDVSGPSIDYALHYYPNIFQKDGKEIVRPENSKRYYESSYIEDLFVSVLPDKVKNALLTCTMYKNKSRRRHTQSQELNGFQLAGVSR